MRKMNRKGTKLMTVAVTMMLATSLLSGCGTQDVESGTDGSKEMNVKTEAETGLVEGVTEASETDDDAVDIELADVIISDWSFKERISYISENYMIAQKDGLYYIIDRDGNVLSDDMLPSGLKNGFETCNFDQEDGTFVIKRTTDEGFYVSAILDRNLNLIFSAGLDDPSIFYVTDYRDGLIFGEQFDIGDDGMVDRDSMIRACGVLKDGTSKFADVQFYTNDGATFNTSYGTMVMRFGRYNDERECFCFTKSADREIAALMAGESVSYTGDEINVPSVDGCPITFNDNLPNKEGWISAALLSGVREENIDGTWNMSATSHGFYNVLTGEYIAEPEDALWSRYLTEDNGVKRCTVINGRAVIAVEEVSDDISYYKYFDLGSGSYESDSEYISAECSYHDLLLVENKDQKWGFVRSDDLSEVGEWYDDASCFCNGYAVVTRDGKGWIIDEDMNKVSEEFDSEGAYAVTDYITSSDLGSRSVFFVMQGGEYHMLTIE